MMSRSCTFPYLKDLPFVAVLEIVILNAHDLFVCKKAPITLRKKFACLPPLGTDVLIPELLPRNPAELWVKIRRYSLKAHWSLSGNPHIYLPVNILGENMCAHEESARLLKLERIVENEGKLTRPSINLNQCKLMRNTALEKNLTAPMY